MKHYMGQLVGEGKAVSSRPMVVHECVDGEGFQVARDEPVDFKCVVEPWDRNNVNLVLEFDDLLDGDRDSARGMIGVQEIPGPPAKAIVGQKWRVEDPGHALCPPDHLDQLVELLLGHLLAPERPK